MADIEFSQTRDGAPAILIPLRSLQVGMDGPLILDWTDTALWALGKLRGGSWDTPSPDTVREIATAITAVEDRLAPRLRGLRDALIRAHLAAGGTYGELALAMDVPRSTAQGRATRVLGESPTVWETWARTGPQTHHAGESCTCGAGSLAEQESRVPHPIETSED